MRKRTQKVLLMQMRHHLPICMLTLDVIRLPQAIAEDPQVVQELASAYKSEYLKKNPRHRRFKFFYHVKELR